MCFFDSHLLCMRTHAKSTWIKKPTRCNQTASPNWHHWKKRCFLKEGKRSEGCFPKQQHNSGFSKNCDLKNNLQSLEVLPWGCLCSPGSSVCSDLLLMKPGPDSFLLQHQSPAIDSSMAQAVSSKAHTVIELNATSTRSSQIKDIQKEKVRPSWWVGITISAPVGIFNQNAKGVSSQVQGRRAVACWWLYTGAKDWKENGGRTTEISKETGHVYTRRSGSGLSWF